jgi:hypothetical protein
MEKKSKADIKKMIADLHAKKNGGDSAKNQPIEQASGGKSSKGASINKTYRPKI